jgi:putative membrane protein
MKRRLAFLAAGFAAPASAHGGSHPVEAAAVGWTWDPWLTLPLAATALLFAVGHARLRARADRGRRLLDRNAWLFGAGWLVLAGAVVSPLHEGGERSFTLHMIEHELIMLVAALLLALSRPVATMLWALPNPARRWLAAGARTRAVAVPWRWLTDPIVATTLQLAVMWLWHAPPLFDRALGHEGWHIAQHLSFLVSALLFWWAMAHGRAGERGYGLAALCLFATSLGGGALGALMALSTSPWYAGYAAMGMSPIGLTPAEDQQLAGLLMWVPGGLVHAGAALVLLHRWLQVGESRRAAVAR